MTLLYLIRHARSTWNAENRMQGQADPPLDDLGRAQARALAERLKGETFHAIYSSPLARARETAEIVAAYHDIPLLFDDRLKERDLGEWTGWTGNEVDEWVTAQPDYNWRLHGPPGGESRAEIIARAAAVFAEIIPAHSEDTVMVMSHGGLLSACLAQLLGAPPDKFVSFAFPNTGVARVNVSDGYVRLLGLEAKHLENPKSQ